MQPWAPPQAQHQALSPHGDSAALQIEWSKWGTGWIRGGREGYGGPTVGPEQETQEVDESGVSLRRPGPGAVTTMPCFLDQNVSLPEPPPLYGLPVIEPPTSFSYGLQSTSLCFAQKVLVSAACNNRKGWLWSPFKDNCLQDLQGKSYYQILGKSH